MRLVLAVLLPCLLACSSGSEEDSTPVTVESVPTTEPLTFEEWSGQVAAWCNEWTPKSEAVASRHPGVDSLEEVAAVFDEMIPLLEESLDEYRQIGRPTDAPDEVRRVGELAEDQLTMMTLLASTARGGNAPGSSQHLQTLNSQTTELVALFDGLGVEDCARTVPIT